MKNFEKENSTEDPKRLNANISPITSPVHKLSNDSKSSMPESQTLSLEQKRAIKALTKLQKFEEKTRKRQFIGIYFEMIMRLKNREFRNIFNSLGVRHLDLAFLEYNERDSELLIFIEKEALKNLLKSNVSHFNRTLRPSLRKPNDEDDEKLRTLLEQYLSSGKTNHGAIFSA